MAPSATRSRVPWAAHVVAAGAVLSLAIWLSSGTMAPYAATWPYPVVSEPCGYLYNLDHRFYFDVFQMIDGQPRAEWEQSPVLRRVLFPLLAYPLMKAAGFEVGGFIASLAFHLASLVALGRFLRTRYGDASAVAGVWLFALYPGITYWAALPYANAVVVPASCACFILLHRLDERPGVRSTVAISAALGVLFTAYDLLPFFGVAAIALLLSRRRYLEVPPAALAMAAAPVLVWLMLVRVAKIPWSNANTALYAETLRAYLHPGSLRGWLGVLAEFPRALAVNFLFSNMLFLPVVFLVLAMSVRAPLTRAEAVLSGAIALIFAFNNLAPLYVVLVAYAARAIAARAALSRPLAGIAVTVFAFGLAANASVAFGPVARVPWASHVYFRFYQHAFPESMNETLAYYGRRPLGFCDRAHPPPRVFIRQRP